MKNRFIYTETKKILSGTKRKFFAKLITSSIIRGSLLAIPIFWSYSINNAAIDSYYAAYQMAFFALVLTMVYYLTQFIDHKLYYKIFSDLYSKYNNLLNKATAQNSIHSLSRFELGGYTNIANNDIDTISIFFTSVPFRIIRMLEFIIIYAYFYMVNIYIFYITITLSLILLIFLIRSGKKIEEYNYIKKEALDKKTAVVHEMFNNIKEIKSFNLFKSINTRSENSCDNLLKSNFNYLVYAADIKVIILGLIEICRYSLVIYGLYLISIGQMELGTIIVIYTYYAKIIENFDIIGTIGSDVRDLQVSLNRFDKMLEYRTINKEATASINKEYLGQIVFADILYGDKNDPILSNFSLEIKPKSITIVTGNTGSGKTGIFDLLLKMNHQHSGTVYIDDNDTSQIPDDNYYNLISLVSQQPKFLNLTIKENLLLIDNDFDKVVEIFKLLNINDYILKLDNGYDTLINSPTENISNDVRILLAITRVLLKNSKIMLFDEALSSLEQSSQTIVLKILTKLKSDHTIVIISREPQIIKYADTIIVMEGNHIVEIGTHQVLMKNKDVYYNLFHTK